MPEPCDHEKTFRTPTENFEICFGCGASRLLGGEIKRTEWLTPNELREDLAQLDEVVDSWIGRHVGWVK